MGSLHFGAVWILGVVVLALGLGIRSGWRTLRDLRAPASVDDALLWWEEKPMSGFRQDPVLASLLAVHDLAIVVMGALAVLTGIRALASPPHWLPASTPFWSRSGEIWIVYGAAVSLAVGLAWYVIGAMLALPLADWRLGRIRVAIAEEGVYRGALFLPWERFGPVRLEPHGGLIHLLSRKSPGLVLLTVHPPTDDLLARLQEVIAAHVAPLPQDQPHPWYRRKAVLGLLLLLTALPLAALGLAAYPSSAIWVWASQGFGAWLAALLGATVIRAYQ